MIAQSLCERNLGYVDLYLSEEPEAILPITFLDQCSASVLFLEDMNPQIEDSIP